MRSKVTLVLSSIFLIALVLQCRYWPNDPVDPGKDPVDPPARDSCCAQVVIGVRNDSGFIPNAKVRLESAVNPDRYHQTLHTNRDGRATFDPVCFGPYIYVITLPGQSHPSAVGRLVVDSCGVVERIVSVAPPGRDSGCCDGAMVLTIRDDDHRPVAEAAVVLKRTGSGEVVATKYTNHDGRVVFTDLCSENYTVIVEADGFQRYETVYFLHCNDEIRATIQLRPAGRDDEHCCDASLTVRVFDDESEPIANAVVSLYTAHPGQQVRHGYTNAEGIIMWDSLCRGRYRLVVSAVVGGSLDSMRETRWVQLECDDDETVTFRLSNQFEQCCYHILEVIVVDSLQSHPIDDVLVQLRTRQRETIDQGYTNSDGRVIFDGICRGEYEVRVAPPERPVQELEVNFTCRNRYVTVVVVYAGNRVFYSFRSD